MALSFAQARTIIQQAIADSSNSTFVDQCLNQAQREVARSRRWPEMMVRAFFNTVAAYDTGTIAVANAGTTWTLTGGTFPTDVATGLYRIALSVSDPWYTITTRTDGNNVITAAYQEDTETASSYIAYKSQYSLAAAVDSVEEMWLHDGGHAIALTNAATDQRVSEFLHYPSGPGVPTSFYAMERDASGYVQVLLGPETPDDVYRVEYVYKKKTTDDTFSGNMDESRWPVVLSRALALAYAPEFYERSMAEYQKYLTLLRQEWVLTGDAGQSHVRVGEARVRYPGTRDYLDNLLGWGRVQDPS
jgi:hypothetical protein